MQSRLASHTHILLSSIMFALLQYFDLIISKHAIENCKINMAEF